MTTFDPFRFRRTRYRSNKIKLTIYNKTEWRKDDLRKLIYAGLKAEGPGDRPYRVYVEYTRQSRGCSGYAYLNSGDITMRLPRPEWIEVVDGKAPEKIVHNFARVLVHEIGHTMGLKHEDMVKSHTIETPWADGLQLRAQVKKVTTVSREDKARAAVERLEAKLIEETKRHKTNIKRLKTLLSKAKRSVYYYDRKKAAGSDLKE